MPVPEASTVIHGFFTGFPLMLKREDAAGEGAGRDTRGIGRIGRIGRIEMRPARAPVATREGACAAQRWDWPPSIRAGVVLQAVLIRRLGEKGSCPQITGQMHAEQELKSKG